MAESFLLSFPLHVVPEESSVGIFAFYQTEGEIQIFKCIYDKRLNVGGKLLQLSINYDSFFKIQFSHFGLLQSCLTTECAGFSFGTHQNE